MAILRRLAALLLLPLLAVGLLAPPAQAHAVLDRSDPADGSALATTPDAIDLWFSESVVPDLSDAHLVDAEGRAVPEAPMSTDPSDPQHLIVIPPPLDAGSYGVLWRVVAADDAHTTTGVIVFSVATGGAPTTSFTVARPSSTVASIVRWLRISALAVLVGGLAMLVVVFRRLRRTLPLGPTTAVVDIVERRVVVATMGAAIAAAAFTGLALVVRLRETSGAGAVLLSTRWGTTWFLSEAALLTVVALTISMVLRARDRTRGIENLVAASTLLVSFLIPLETMQSHAAALDPATSLLAATVHVLAALLWIGAVAMLALVLWIVRGLPERGEVLRAIRSPFSWMAATSVALIIMTGLFEAGAEVATPGDLVGTAYGRLLLCKGALLAVAGGLGVRNARRLHSVRGRDPRVRISRRSVLAEAAVGISILLAAAVLSDTPPALDGASSATPAAAPRTVSATADDLLTTLSVTPNRAGVNGLTVVAASSRRPPPAPIEQVALRLVPPHGGASIELPLVPVRDDTYFGSTDIGRVGGWRATIIVTRAGEHIALPVRWTVDPSPPPAVPDPQPRTLAPITGALTLLVAAGALGAAAIVILRRRRKPETLGPASDDEDAGTREDHPTLEVVR